MEVTGIISNILPEENGVGKQSGKPWRTQTFVIKNNDGYQGQEQIYAFSIFGDEKIDKFNQYNKIGDNVKVSFNIDTNEYNGKYYTKLSAWSVFKENDAPTQNPGATPAASPVPNPNEISEDSLPF